MSAPKKKILRFGKVAVAAHAIHTLTFFLLGITGTLIYADFLDFLAPVFGGMQGARLVHRIAAVAFAGVPILSVLMNPKGFAEWMKVVFTWGKNDLAFFKAFLQEFFGGHADIPPQSKFNAGEKINSMLQVSGCLAIALSGFVIWFPEVFPAGLVSIAYPLHTGAFAVTGTAIFGHMYLAMGHPATNVALSGMVTGYIDADVAKGHYRTWYDEQIASGNLTEGDSFKF